MNQRNRILFILFIFLLTFTGCTNKPENSAQTSTLIPSPTKLPSPTELPTPVPTTIPTLNALDFLNP